MAESSVWSSVTPPSEAPTSAGTSATITDLPLLSEEDPDDDEEEDPESDDDDDICIFSGTELRVFPNRRTAEPDG